MMTDQDRKDSPRSDAAAPRVMRSQELLQGRSEIWIEHGGQIYRLRQTRSGKLILQK